MILDSNTLFGTWQKDTLDRSLDKLLHILRTNGIDRALTCSARGVWDSFAEGNAETLRVCAAHSELLPVATVRPGDWFQCREEIQSLRERGFRMARFFPHTQGWQVTHLTFRRLVDDLVACGLPLFFDNGFENVPVIAPMVDTFCGTDVPLIFSATSYWLAEFLAACELHPHTYTDTWQLFLLNEIEIIRDEVGIEHVLFGTRAPFDMPGPCLEVVRHSRLMEEEKGKVLGGNVLSLIGEPAGGSDGGPANSRPLQTATATAVLNAQSPVPNPLPLIDIHAHYGGWVGLPNPYTSIENLLDTCRRFNIEHCCLSSTSAIGYDPVEGNERVREIIEGHPELHGYVVIHPGYPEQSLAQMEELLALPNFVGAKLHPKHCGYQADAPEARPLLEYLVELGKPILVHTWFDEMCLAMGHAADLFPELTLIMGHMGGDDWETALQVAADRPNLHLELCSGLSPWGKLEKSVSIVGAERLLFGSDLTLLDPGYTLGLATGAEIGEAEKRMILYGNAKRLFGF
ncbi:MAG: amidohydrolase family protein [Armatimonadetes bacterium]|nr:amidohydrolase family protein [Armatimonadota bacterium]